MGRDTRTCKHKRAHSHMWFSRVMLLKQSWIRPRTKKMISLVNHRSSITLKWVWGEPFIAHVYITVMLMVTFIAECSGKVTGMGEKTFVVTETISIYDPPHPHTTMSSGDLLAGASNNQVNSHTPRPSP